jgi:hypothetical protein
VYSTCLYCTKDLGANEVLETLPIGRRVAFDARQGRLWVVCRSCEKWNLVPFDTRLETIDACEKLFSETRVRFSTDNIGIARLKEGLELVRVGPAQRPEFAAWRYGDQFGRRRKRYAIQIGGVALATGAVVIGGHPAMVFLRTAGIGGTFAWQAVFQGMGLYSRRRAVVRVPTPDAPNGVLTGTQLTKASIVSQHPGWSLWVPVFTETRGGFATALRTRDTEFHGAAAVEVLGKIMPRLNASGGSKSRVQEAVALMDERSPLEEPRAGRLKELHPAVRLALEMAAHEDTERAALAGELKLLERQWREAEEVAKIADSLAVSDDVEREAERRK